MRKITVNASKKYDVVIKKGALKLIGEYSISCSFFVRVLVTSKI